MFRRLWNSLFGRQPKSIVVHVPRENIPVRRASDAEISGDETQSTGMADMSVASLTAICDAYWDRLINGPHVPPQDAFSASEVSTYNQYVQAMNELGTRGPEILEWAIARVRHSEYDAREQAAWLLGELATRNQLGDKKPSAIDELTWLATRSVEEDTKEAQGNTAAVLDLGKLGDRRAVVALRHILTSPDWDDDELQWDAAGTLGNLLRESFAKSEDPVAAAKAWLERHPND